MTIDPVALTQALIRRPSVTPADAGAMDVLQAALQDIGFACRRMRFGAIENLYARRGSSGPNLCFAGHTDVVPVGDAKAWSHEPFDAALHNGVLIGRGAVDMKGAIAAFVAAAEQVQVGGSLSLLITGDEEGDAEDGTARVVEALRAEGERIDHCVVGEPTSAAVLGDQLKVGRRGSLGAVITVEGRQGHVAYPAAAANPIRPLIRLLDRLQSPSAGPRPSRLSAVQSRSHHHRRRQPGQQCDPGPGHGAAEHPASTPPTTATAWPPGWRPRRAAVAADFCDPDHPDRTRLTGNAFLTEPGAVRRRPCPASVEDVLGRKPTLSTTHGGISDARFICAASARWWNWAWSGRPCTRSTNRRRSRTSAVLTEVYGRVIERYFVAFG